VGVSKKLESDNEADGSQNGGLSPSITRRAFVGAVGVATLVSLGAPISAAPAHAAQAWGGFQNGFIPLSAMTRVSYPGVNYWYWDGPGTVDGVYLEPGAASALVSMLAAYASATGSYLNVNEGYRSYAGQQYWYGREPYPGGAPGSSNHGWGKAVDFDSFSTSQENWVRANCARFAYEPLAGDRVHFSYVGPNGGPARARRRIMFAVIAGQDGIWWFVNSMTGKKAAIQSAHLGALFDIQWWFLGNDPGTRQLPVATFGLFQSYVTATT
jgi:hypothetical protein